MDCQMVNCSRGGGLALHGVRMGTGSRSGVLELTVYGPSPCEDDPCDDSNNGDDNANCQTSFGT
jgi:hypothetical protein